MRRGQRPQVELQDVVGRQHDDRVRPVSAEEIAARLERLDEAPGVACMPGSDRRARRSAAAAPPARTTCAPSAASVTGANTHTSRTPEFASVARAKSMKRYWPANGASAAPPGETRGSRLALPPPATTPPSSRPSIGSSFVPSLNAADS